MDEQRAEVGIALFGDPSLSDLAAGGVLPRRQLQPGRELAAILELFGVADAGKHGGGGDRLDPRNRHQPLRRFTVADQVVEFAVVGENLHVERSKTKPGVMEQPPGAWRNSRACSLIHGVSEAAYYQWKSK